VHFGAIYGIGVTGSIAMYLLMNLMSDAGITILTTVSVLGYCLLPMVLLAFLSLAIPLTYEPRKLFFFDMLNLFCSGLLGVVLAGLAISWCTYSAASMFVLASSMTNQRLLVAYPLALFYTCFALFTIF